MPSKSGNWWGFGSQVLYWVSQGESSTSAVEREAVAAVAVEVLLDVALMLVDVARLPVAVGPFRQHGRQPREPQEAAQAGGGRRVAEHVQAKRPGRRARRHADAVAEVELRAVAVGLEPE